MTQDASKDFFLSYNQAAELILREALANGEEKYGIDHPGTSYLLNNLAALYGKRGKYMEAVTLCQRILSIKEKTLGPEHPDTARTLGNLAILYADQSKYEEAETLYQRALAIFEKMQRPEHIDSMRARKNLANLYQNQGKYEEGEVLHQSALVIYDQTLWPEHPITELAYDELRQNTSHNIGKIVEPLNKYIGPNQMMAARLVVLHRILKSTGSLYLHCDSTESYYHFPQMEYGLSQNTHIDHCRSAPI